MFLKLSIDKNRIKRTRRTSRRSVASFSNYKTYLIKTFFNDTAMTETLTSKSKSLFSYFIFGPLTQCWLEVFFSSSSSFPILHFVFTPFIQNWNRFFEIFIVHDENKQPTNKKQQEKNYIRHVSIASGCFSTILKNEIIKWFGDCTFFFCCLFLFINFF